MANSPTILRAKLAHDIEWPCKVRLSKRARKVKLSMDRQNHVELVLPQTHTYSLEQQEELLQAMLPWMQKNLDKKLTCSAQMLKAQELWQEYTYGFDAHILPSFIDLPALSERWHVSLHAKEGGYVRLKELQAPTRSHTHTHDTEAFCEGKLGIFARQEEVYTCCALLQKWLIHRAKPHLMRTTWELAERMGVSVGKVTVKAQRGRWGSCTASGNIALNCRLILLPPRLMEHVILHELCHRVHMNHSLAFKNLLASVSAQSVQKDIEISDAWENLPHWAILKK